MNIGKSSDNKVLWNSVERNKYAMALVQSINAPEKEGMKLPDHEEVALRVLPKNRHRPASSLMTERVKLRTLGESLLTPEVTLASATQAAPVAATLPVKPVRVVAIADLTTKPSEKVTKYNLEELVATMINAKMPHILEKALEESMEEVITELKPHMKSEMRAYLAGDSKDMVVKFFSRTFDADDHSELPTASGTAPVVVAAKPKTVKIGIVGLTERQFNETTSRFSRADVYLRYLNGSNPVHAGRSAANMDHVIAVSGGANTVGKQVFYSIKAKLGVYGVMHTVQGHPALLEEINKLIAANVAN